MSKPRVLNLTLTDGISVTEHASVVKQRDQKIVGYAESERDGIVSRADQLESGDIESHIAGPSPKGEVDTLKVGQTLVNAMNLMGASWGPVALGSEPADCEAADLADSSVKLHVQVVRAIADPAHWRTLSCQGRIDLELSAEAAAGQLLDAIRSKADRYPPAVRSTLVLALDANRLPQMVLSEVRAAASSRASETCKSVGFREVWVVGPTHELTYRLDDGVA